MMAIEVIADVFTQIVQISLQASVVVVVILLLQTRLSPHNRPRWQYAVWLIRIARLIIPI